MRGARPDLRLRDLLARRACEGLDPQGERELSLRLPGAAGRAEVERWEIAAAAACLGLLGGGREACTPLPRDLRRRLEASAPGRLRPQPPPPRNEGA